MLTWDFITVLPSENHKFRFTNTSALSLVGLTKEQLISSIVKTLESPNEVYADVRRSRYFLKKLDDLYLNVIVVGDRVRTTYLMGRGTFTRMGKTRWLHRLY